VRSENTKRKNVWRELNTALAQKNIRPTKAGRESVLVWGCFTYMGVGKIAFDGNFKSNDYIKILEDNLLDTISHLKLEDDFIFQQDNDPKHISQATKSFLKNNQITFYANGSGAKGSNDYAFHFDFFANVLPKVSIYS